GHPRHPPVPGRLRLDPALHRQRRGRGLPAGLPGPLVHSRAGVSAPPPARILLLDVEGTTTSVSFVYDVLFPFARAGVEEFLRASLPGQATVRDDVARLAAERRVESEAGAPPWCDGDDEETL